MVICSSEFGRYRQRGGSDVIDNNWLLTPPPPHGPAVRSLTVGSESSGNDAVYVAV
jgi:hypothetical protein